MKIKRKIVEIDESLCNGCGQCVPSCAEGAIQIIDGKARLVADRQCDGLGACLGHCPTGALRIVERDAEVFDEAQVPASPPHAHPGCPSAHAQRLAARPQADAGPRAAQSALGHWPVQIRLINPKADFLQDADLVVAADCVPVAYPNLHQDFLKDKVIMLGCPKFDDTELYIERFEAIFRESHVRSVTVLVMQVPCCQGLPLIVREGARRAGKGGNVPIEKVIITLDGQIQGREQVVA